jgi:hypothetical protein
MRPATVTPARLRPLRELLSEDTRELLAQLDATGCMAALPWARTPCPNTATQSDGYCDECREALNERGEEDDEW